MTTAAHPHLIAKRDAADERDFQFTPAERTIPPAADLRKHCPPVYNQMPLHSCSAHALAAAFQLIASAAGTPIEPPSRLFLYYNARVLEKEADRDDGVTIRNAIKAAAKPGACPETLWPYDVDRWMEKPPQGAYDGIHTHAVAYYRIPRTIEAMKACLAEGYPFVLGIEMFQSTIATAQSTGRLSLPPADETPMGGHAVLAVGYDATTITALNSLGAAFGDAGYLHIPYDYLLSDKLSYDFWTIRKIE